MSATTLNDLGTHGKNRAWVAHRTFKNKLGSVQMKNMLVIRRMVEVAVAAASCKRIGNASLGVHASHEKFHLQDNP